MIYLVYSLLFYVSKTCVALSHVTNQYVIMCVTVNYEFCIHYAIKIICLQKVLQCEQNACHIC